MWLLANGFNESQQILSRHPKIDETKSVFKLWIYFYLKITICCPAFNVNGIETGGFYFSGCPML